MRWWTLNFMVMVKTIINCVIQVTDVKGEKLKPIYWNSSNPIFLHDNTNHVFVVRILDSIEIICPKYEANTSRSLIEYSVIHMVNKYGYDTCKTDNAKTIGFCNTPYSEQSIIIVFREFTPSIAGLEFKPDTDYYFVSTSSGSASGIWQREGGLCGRKNMKLRFEVKQRQEEINTPTPALSHYEYDDDDSDYRIQKPKEKLPPSVFPSGNGYIEYVWPPQHKLSHSVSPTVRPTSWPNWLYFPIYATSTPHNNNQNKLKNHASSGLRTSSLSTSVLITISLILVYLFFRRQIC